ncbi:hypothetical protein QR98_0061880 [Sarcoptes scabiei]|uniref:VWFA domain-containing protein n=1 Tax=Sarcoptes scabiei TaxID=52283 RepID=A0A132A9X3_SARSC|nr:hypothetical protein QR98_0061880 [Sarcoptes scabiei]
MNVLFLILVDESLSMKEKKAEVVNGLNQFIDVQREINPDSRLILIKFNNSVTIMHQANLLFFFSYVEPTISGANINDIEPIRMYEYNPCGRTALFDAVDCGLNLAERLRSKQDRLVCIIVTDGEDNASRNQQSTKTIKKLVRKYESQPDCSFTYLGRSSEFWYRKKPVSKISYESHRHRFYPQSSSTIIALAQRRHHRTTSTTPQYQSVTS